MSYQIQLRRDTAANWTATNPILAQGEIGLELVTNKYKIGDGVTAWTSLAYVVSGVENLVDLLDVDASSIADGTMIVVEEVLEGVFEHKYQPQPSIPSDVSDLSDDTGLLFSGDYDDLDNQPDLSSLHTHNTDTILDKNGTHEVSAQEIREHINDADIHFEINDSIASTSSVYSSDKVGTLLSGKENSLGFTPTQKLTATITIAVADWSGGLTCTKEVAGLLPTDTVLPVMDRTNFTLYSDAYITADSSVAGEITFTCETTPTAEIVIPIEIIR